MDAPVLNYSNTLTEFYWDAISGADTYYIYADGEIYDSTTETSYSATSIPNGSVIYVTAYNSGTEEESAASNTITFYSSLSAPYIVISGTTISWNAVSGANFYKVYLNDSVTVSQAGTTYNFDSGTLETGDKIFVIAVNTTMNVFSSRSNNIYYNVVAPDAPVIDLTDLEVSWSSVSGADSYKIYVNSSYSTSTTNLYYTFSSLTDGDNINVTSYNSTYSLESGYSNTETYSETPPPSTTNKIIHRRRLIN